MITKDDVEGMPHEEWQNLWEIVTTEARRRETLATARARAEQAAQEYAAAVVVPDRIPDASDMEATAVVGPGEHLMADGVEWINTSGAWLSPHTAGPADYPMGWRHADTSTLPTADPWAPWVSYAADALVTHSDAIYRCIQPHTSQPGWEPPNVPALWTLA